MFSTYFSAFLLYGIPLFVTVFWIVSLVLYVGARRKVKRSPGAVPKEILDKRKLLLVISSVLAGVLLVIVLGFVGLLYMAVAYM